MAEQIIQKLMNEKRCSIWPECSCNRVLCHWQDKLDNDDVAWEREELVWAECLIFHALSCAAAHCPNPKIRTYATLQLLNPWWHRQRRGEELTKEFCEARRAQG